MIHQTNEFDPASPDILARCGMTRIYDLAAWDRTAHRQADRPTALRGVLCGREVIEIADTVDHIIAIERERRRSVSRRSTNSCPCVKPAITQRPIAVDHPNAKRASGVR